MAVKTVYKDPNNNLVIKIYKCIYIHHHVQHRTISTSRSHTCGNIYLQISYMLWQYLPPDLMHVVAISNSRSHTCCGNIYLQISCILWQYLTPDLMHVVAISTSRSHACCGNIYLQISYMLWQYLTPDLMHVVAISTSRSHTYCGNI